MRHDVYKSFEDGQKPYDLALEFFAKPQRQIHVQLVG